MTTRSPVAADVLRRELPGDRRATAFCADLVRIPSPSGDEERAVRRAVQEMKDLRLDDAFVDATGNALGVVRSRSREKRPDPLMLCSHLDCVDAGEASSWELGPFSGVVRDGRLFGRGATDAKSCVAAQVHAAATLRALRDEGAVELHHDLVVAAVVQEEVGGVGAAGLLDDPAMRPAAAIVGEPSEGHLAFGHRGRVEIELTFRGRAGHASRPDLARSPHPSAARFVLALHEARHDSAPRLGASSAAITQVSTRPTSVNVIPEEVRLVVDWRHVPGETPTIACERVLAIARASCEDRVVATACVPTLDLAAWTGASRAIERVSLPFAVDPDAELFRAALATLGSGLGVEVGAIPWTFASDGGRLAEAGATCVGYGPGDMGCMHARDESVSVALLEQAVMGNVLLLCSLDESLRRASP